VDASQPFTSVAIQAPFGAWLAPLMVVVKMKLKRIAKVACVVVCALFLLAATD